MAGPITRGLSPLPIRNTLTSNSDQPIVVDKDIRGSLQYISGDSDDQLLDISGRRLQEGMLVYVKKAYSESDGSITRSGETYYQYTLLDGDSEVRNFGDGSLANNIGNWNELVVGGRADSDQIFLQIESDSIPSATGSYLISYDSETERFSLKLDSDLIFQTQDVIDTIQNYSNLNLESDVIKNRHIDDKQIDSDHLESDLLLKLLNQGPDTYVKSGEIQSTNLRLYSESDKTGLIATIGISNLQDTVSVNEVRGTFVSTGDIQLNILSDDSDSDSESEIQLNLNDGVIESEHIKSPFIDTILNSNIDSSLVVPILEGLESDLDIDIRGQVTYPGSYFTLVEQTESEYLMERFIFFTNPTPEILIGSTFSSITIDEIIIRDTSGSTELLTETFSPFTVVRASTNRQTVLNFFDALKENVGASRHFSINTTTTNEAVDISSSPLPPLFFDEDTDSDLEVFFNSNLYNIANNFILEFRNNDSELFSLNNFDVIGDIGGGIQISNNNVGGENGAVISRFEGAGGWTQETIIVNAPTDTSINHVIFSNANTVDDNEVYIDAVAKRAETVIDDSIDSDAIDSNLLTRLLEERTDSEIIGVIEGYDSDLKIDIRGQVTGQLTYAGEYTVGFLTGTESEYLTTTYEISNPGPILIGSDRDSVTLNKIVIDFRGGTTVLIEETAPSFTIVRSDSSTQTVQNLIDALIVAWPVDRDFTSNTISTTGVDISASPLPQFYFESDSDNLKVSFGANLRAADTSNVNFDLEFFENNDKKFIIGPFDVSNPQNSTNDVVLQTSFIGGVNGDVFTRDTNTWDSETVTLNGPEIFPINRVIFSNESDDDEVYVNAVVSRAESVVDGAIDEDAMDGVLLTKLITTDQEITDVIADNSDLKYKGLSDTYLTLESDVIEGIHIKDSEIILRHLTLGLINELQQTESDIVGVLVTHDSDIEIDILGQVTYNGIYYTDGIVRSDSDFRATIYAPAANPDILVSSTQNITRVTIELVTGNTSIVSEATDFDIELGANNSETVQNFIDALIANFPASRDPSEITYTIHNNSAGDLYVPGNSELPPFFFESDSGGFKVAFNHTLHSVYNNDDDFNISFYESENAQQSFRLSLFDVNSATDPTVGVAFNGFGNAGGWDIFDGTGNTWVTETVQVTGPTDHNTNRVMFSNDSDANVVYVDAIANSVSSYIDGSIDSDAINSDLLDKLLKNDNTQLDSEQVISIIESDSNLDLKLNVITGKHIAPLSIESEHIESELLSKLLKDDDTGRSESEIIDIVGSIDIDFGNVDVIQTSDTFSAFSFTSTDYDLGGIRSPRAGYDFGSI